METSPRPPQPVVEGVVGNDLEIVTVVCPVPVTALVSNGVSEVVMDLLTCPAARGPGLIVTAQLPFTRMDGVVGVVMPILMEL